MTYLVCDAWESILLLDVVGHIADVHLDARDRQHHLILVLVLAALTCPAPVVVTAKLELVGGKVVTLDHEVLNNDVHSWIGHLNSWDWNVADILEEGRKEDLSQILHQMRLELWLSVVVVAKIFEQFVHGVGERLVLWVVFELVGKEFTLIDNAVGVAPIALTQQEVAAVVEAVPLLVGLILEDIALLLQALADELVGILLSRQHSFHRS